MDFGRFQNFRFSENFEVFGIVSGRQGPIPMPHVQGIIGRERLRPLPEPVIPETPRQPGGGQRVLPNPLERLGGGPIVIPESPLFREAPIESPTG